MEKDALKEFCDNYNLKNLITEPTCFKNAQNPTLIDLILTNKPKCFQSSMCIETGIKLKLNMGHLLVAHADYAKHICITLVLFNI